MYLSFKNLLDFFFILKSLQGLDDGGGKLCLMEK